MTHRCKAIPRLRLTAPERAPWVILLSFAHNISVVVTASEGSCCSRHTQVPTASSGVAYYSGLPVMSHAASAAHTTTTASLVGGQSKAVPSSVSRHSVFKHRPFLGDQVQHRRCPQARALYRSHTVCITKVDEAEFQSEVLKVWLHSGHCQRRMARYASVSCTAE